MKFKQTMGVEFAVGAYTNFGDDHISPIEHPTIEHYLQSKLLLFQNCQWVWSTWIWTSLRVCSRRRGCASAC